MHDHLVDTRRYRVKNARTGPKWVKINSTYYPANIYLLKFNNRNTRKRCEICSKLTIKTPEWRQRRRSGILISNFEPISHLFLVFLLLTLNK